jgi:hypothetical protein
LTIEAVLEKENCEQKIADFLAEDEIIERTKNCTAYFEKFITASSIVDRNLIVS